VFFEDAATVVVEFALVRDFETRALEAKVEPSYAREERSNCGLPRDFF
jgi:hypothetical protein